MISPRRKKITYRTQDGTKEVLIGKSLTSTVSSLYELEKVPVCGGKEEDAHSG